MRVLALHTALYVAIDTPCVRHFMHLLVRAIVRVMIVPLCCRMLLESRMHRYLYPIRGI